MQISVFTYMMRVAAGRVYLEWTIQWGSNDWRGGRFSVRSYNYVLRVCVCVWYQVKWVGNGFEYLMHVCVSSRRILVRQWSQLPTDCLANASHIFTYTYSRMLVMISSLRVNTFFFVAVRRNHIYEHCSGVCVNSIRVSTANCEYVESLSWALCHIMC